MPIGGGNRPASASVAGSEDRLADRLRGLAGRPRTVPALLVASLFLVVLLFPRGMPAGIYGLGVVFGARAALAVLGLVLVYRSNRILNFAQMQMGTVGAVLFFDLVRHHTIVRGLDAMCGCAGPVTSPHAWATHTEYWLSMLIALVVSLAIGFLVYILVVRRFRDAPPLVGTVATIALAEGLTYVVGASGIPKLFGDKNLNGATPPPADVRIHFSVSVFHLADVLAVAVAMVAMAGLALFFRRTRTGVAVRASSENPDRAASLGVDNTRVAAVVWSITGLLSGLAAVLAVMSGSATGGGSTSSLVRVLAAAVLAGMTDLPLAVLAAIAIAVLDQGVLWSYRSGLLVDAVVFVFLLVALLLRRQPRVGRVDSDGGSWRAAREVRPIPTELAGLPDVRRLRRRVAAGVALIAVVYPFLVSAGDVSSASITLIYGIIGMSLLLLTGWAGLISLGQFGLAAVGGYTVALVGGRLGAPFLVALPLAALVGAAVAVLLGLPSLRIRGLYLAVTTLAFAVATTSVLLNEQYGGQYVPSAIGRPSLFGLTLRDERVFYFVCLVFLVLSVLAVVGMRRSPTARSLIAVRDNDRAAEAFGINPVRARLEVFAVSGLLAAVAGGLFVYQQRGIAVGNFAVDVSLTLFLMVVIGGLGSTAGPILGAVFVGFLTTRFGAVSSVYTALAVVLVLVASPGGLTHLLFRTRDSLLRRIAVRHRIRVPSLLADGRDLDLDARAPIRPKLSGPGTPAYVPVVYRLEHKPLEVPRVAATGKGAQ